MASCACCGNENHAALYCLRCGRPAETVRLVPKVDPPRARDLLPDLPVPEVVAAARVGTVYEVSARPA